MKARIPKHREFIINFPDSIDQNKANCRKSTASSIRSNTFSNF